MPDVFLPCLNKGDDDDDDDAFLWSMFTCNLIKLHLLWKMFNG